MKLEKRFFRHVLKGDSGECWIWLGASTNLGYGKFWLEGLDGKKNCTSATRASWFIAYGVMPSPQLLVLHHCDVPACVNPNHLFLGNQTENMRDCSRKGRNNHKYPAEVIRQLRSDDLSGSYSRRDLSKKYRMPENYISMIVRGLSRRVALEAL